MYLAFEWKDAATGLVLLTKPVSPKKTVAVQEDDPMDSSKTISVTEQEIDKESEEFYKYQSEFKKYINSKFKYGEDLQKYSTIILGQYSPKTEELLKAKETYDDLKIKYDSIGLLKLVEKLCYSYHAHKYTPLGAWEGLDKLCNLV